jgi:hypothetical protein
VKLLLLVLVVGSSVFAQHGGPGEARAGAGGPRLNRPPGRFVAPPPVAHPVHAPLAIVPYPVYYGGYYWCDPAYCNSNQGYDPNAPAPASNNNGTAYDDSGYGGAPPQPPVVIMNPGYQPETANGVMHDYSNANLPPPGGSAKPDAQPTIYLIAMTDHTILAAIAYWVDGDTLDYITQDGDQNRVSLALVDREFSRKLNSDRGVEFRLPPAK